MKTPFVALLTAIFTVLVPGPRTARAQSQQKDSSTGGTKYSLEPSSKTIEWGYYDATVPPVLRIRSGDTVEIRTLITSSPQRLQDAGIPPNEVEQSLRDIFQQVTVKGPGPHILTGPIYVEDAQPGDALEIRIAAIRLAVSYAYNASNPGTGFLAEDYPSAKMKIIPLDEKRGVARFADGVELPLQPFFWKYGCRAARVVGPR
jgi:acetamidase/formamidase